MHALLRRSLPALVLPLALLGLSPAAQAAPPAAGPAVTATGGDAPTPDEVTDALASAPDALVPATAAVTRSGAGRVVSGDVAVPRDADEPVRLGPADLGVTIGLPVSGDAPSVVRDGVSIFTDEASATSVAVNPLAGGGTQFLVAIGAEYSPETYAFPVDVPDGARLELTEDGGARVTDGAGTLATIPAPWAKDARGADVPTHYEIADGALVQVVDHAGSGAAYPVLADPSIFSCDAWAATCVKFTKSETVAISRYANPGLVGAFTWASMVCGKIPVAIVAGGCAVYVSVYAYLLSRSFDGAAGSGKCVEMHFSRVGAPLWWKTEGC